MLKKIYILTFILFVILIAPAYANNVGPITVNATITANEIKFDPEIIPENTPFIIHVINKAGAPVELENSDTSVEVYAGMDKTFKIGLNAGKYKFFNDFNAKTKTAELTVANQTQFTANIKAVSANYLGRPTELLGKTVLTNRGSSIAEVTFIMWRESIEALLVVGIVFSWLKQMKTGKREGMLFLGLGIILGIMSAMCLAIVLIKLSSGLSRNATEYLQASLTFLAALMIVYMVKWMRENGKKLKSEMHSTLVKGGSRRWNLSILIVVAVAIAREGSEAVIFIYALGFGEHGVITISMFTAVVVGMLLAVVTVYLLSLGNKIFSWLYFFKVTEILLLLLGGAMLLNCIDILVTANVLPVLKAQFWDTSSILSDGGLLTPLLSSLIGYRATPSLIDVLVYAIYWIGVLYFIRTKKMHSKKVIS